MSFNPFSLEGRRILVTGASSGIGRQVAISCAEMGATVIVTGRDEARLGATLASLAGVGHQAVPADLSVPDEIARVAAAVGPLDGLVHAAGIAKLVPFRMISAKHLEELLAINLHAPVLLTQALLKARALRPKCSIVLIGSVASEIGPIASAAYAASKAALLGASRSLAQEIGSQGMRSNVIAPGYIRTPMLERLGSGGALLDDLVNVAPLGIGEVDDVAHAVVFFLSDASRWVTRSFFVIDGGITVPMSI